MRWRYLAMIAVLALAYYAAAWLGLRVTMVSSNVSPLFPATGVALVGLLLFGYRLWPGIALGAFWATAPDTSLWVGLGVAVGKTLEAGLAVYLMRRLAGFGRSLDRLQDVLGLVFFGAMLGSVVGATMGVASLCLGNFAAWEAFFDLWLVWWVGDTMGVLLTAPFIWYGRSRFESEWTSPGRSSSPPCPPRCCSPVRWPSEDSSPLRY